MSNPKEDKHFYVDNASPTEVANVLRILTPTIGKTPDDIALELTRDYGYSMQKDHSYSPRRLYDLGLAEQYKNASKTFYTLSSIGSKVQSIASYDEYYAYDILHYLHYTGYRIRGRKSLWSYRKCCELIWSMKSIGDKQHIAQMIQSFMAMEFPELDFSAKVGARFNHTAVGAVCTWLKALSPSAFAQHQLVPRSIEHYELSLLALDDLYTSTCIRYGDPIILSEEIADQIRSIFLVDPQCSYDNLLLATQIASHIISKRDTLAGTAFTLKRPFTVEDL